ncbi:piggyBac transposable element-derived protein 4-like isoform X2 [Macrobrachium nipponense]
MQENDEVQYDCDTGETRMHSVDDEFKEEKCTFETEDPGSAHHSTPPGNCDQVRDQSFRNKLPQVPSTKEEKSYVVVFREFEDGEFADSDSENDESDEDNDILDGLGLSDDGDGDDDDDMIDPTYPEEESTGTGRDENVDSAAEFSGDDDGWTEGSDYIPNEYDFTGKAGVTDAFKLSGHSDESDYFRLFMDDEVVQIMVDETNRYHAQRVADRPLVVGRSKAWQDVSLREMVVFLAITLLMPHVAKHRIRDYWSTDMYIHTPVFSQNMSRDRYHALYRFLHFTDNNLKGAHSKDRLWKIRIIMNQIRDRFKRYFYPFQNLVVDESHVLFKSGNIFKQYIRSKRHRFGIKIHVLCDCKTGCVMDVVFYTGKDEYIPVFDPLGRSGAVVKSLMTPYLGKGHIVYTSHHYTSPGLSEYLHHSNTGLVGTVREHRRGMAVFPSGLKKGETALRKKGHHLAVKWKDRKEFTLLTTIHTGELVPTGRFEHQTGDQCMKLDVVTDYIKNMRVVDKCEMQMGNVECARRSPKWYIKAFLHLVDICMLNAYNVYKHKTRKSMSLRNFSLSVCKQLLNKYATFQPERVGRRVLTIQTDRIAPDQWCQRHYIASVPPTQSRAKGQKLCYVCSNTKKRKQMKNKRVTTWCPSCKVGLCLGCFREYHSYVKF